MHSRSHPPSDPGSPSGGLGGDRHRAGRSCLAFASLVLVLGGCTGAGGGTPHSLIYEPDRFAETLRQRDPGLPESLLAPPYLVDPLSVERARKTVFAAPRGPARVIALVELLQLAEPEGFGIRYARAVSSTARLTLENRQGNCLSMASVLVGLGRGFGWPIYFARARPLNPESTELSGVHVVYDHMVVIVVSKTVRLIVDFTGQVDDRYQITPIDDLTAYAHFLNNRAGSVIINADGKPSTKEWERSLEGFQRATRIQPELGAAWNNQGIALARLGRFEEARQAYERAVASDAAFGSPQRNLAIMATRATGDPSILRDAPAP